MSFSLSIPDFAEFARPLSRFSPNPATSVRSYCVRSPASLENSAYRWCRTASRALSVFSFSLSPAASSSESSGVTQSMSKAGYPYDNAPMERYFNTLKNECTNLHEFRTEEQMYQTVEEFAYATYNHVRPPFLQRDITLPNPTAATR